MLRKESVKKNTESLHDYYSRMKELVKGIEDDTMLSSLKKPALRVLKSVHHELLLNYVPESFLRGTLQHVEKLFTADSTRDFQDAVDDYNSFLWMSGAKGVGKLFLSALVELFTFAFIAANIVAITLLAVFCPPALAVPVSIFGTLFSAGLIAAPAIFGLHLFSSGRHQLNSAISQHGFYKQAYKLSVEAVEPSNTPALQPVQ